MNSYGDRHKRAKKFKMAKVKKERPDIVKKEPIEASKALPEPEEKDLTQHIRDRVQLMREVFSVLRGRELLAMAPDGLRGLKVDDLQELCLEEVLGISSKRLMSILDGYACPSDTDSDSQDEADQLETISLDSISSAEDALIIPETSNKKAKKKSKIAHQKAGKRRKEKGKEPPAEAARSSAAGLRPGTAGMTVLELLELQARARAIRAQLDAVGSTRVDASDDEVEEREAQDSDESSGDDEVVIKEEPAEVVEIASSGDEAGTSGHKSKKDKGKNAEATSKSKSPQPGTSKSASADNHKSIPPLSPTLQIIMPAVHTQQQPRKIKLNRNNILVSVSNTKPDVAKEDVNLRNKMEECVVIDLDKNDCVKEIANVAVEVNKNVVTIDESLVVKAKKVKKRRKSAKLKKRRGSDEDEIMLQLSDSEKMDLLESCETSSSSDESDEEEVVKAGKKNVDGDVCVIEDSVKDIEQITEEKCGNNVSLEDKSVDEEKQSDENVSVEEVKEKDNVLHESVEQIENNDQVAMEDGIVERVTEKVVEVTCVVTEDDVVTDQVAQSVPVTVPVPQSDLLPVLVLDVDPVPVAVPDNIVTPPAVSEIDTLKEVQKKDKGEGKKKKKSKKSRKRRKSDNDRTSDESGDEKSKNKSDSQGKKKLQNNQKDLEKFQQREAAGLQYISNEKSFETNNSESQSVSGDILKDVGEVAGKKIVDHELSEGECSYSSDDVEITEDKCEVVCISDSSSSSDGGLGRNGKDKARKYRKRSVNVENVVEDEITEGVAEEIIKEVDNTVDSVKSVDDLLENTNDKALGDEAVITDVVEGEKAVDERNDDDDSEDMPVFEISDDSSGDEGGNYLSKEPTTEEIEELSRKIDTEIEREDIVFEGMDLRIKSISEMEKVNKGNEDGLIDGVSWKDRWLESDKVKKVMATSNLCNALRKKNKQLKQKLAQGPKENDDHSVVEKEISETKNDTVQKADNVVENIDEKVNEDVLNAEEKKIDDPRIDEGSVDHYKMLMGSTKYVDPVKEVDLNEGNVSMAKDAKQLMKMYKKLLKIHRKAEGDEEGVKKKSKKDKKDRKERKERKRLKLKLKESGLDTVSNNLNGVEKDLRKVDSVENDLMISSSSDIVSKKDQESVKNDVKVPTEELKESGLVKSLDIIGKSCEINELKENKGS